MLQKNKKTAKWINNEKKICIKKLKNYKKSGKLKSVGIVFFSCFLFFITYVFFVNNNTKQLKRSPEKVRTQANFDIIKKDVLQNKIKSDEKERKSDNHHRTSDIAYVKDKYIVIIKENEVFLTNAKNGSFITSTSLPLNANDDKIYYYNIFTTDNNIIVTGYRQDEQTLEIVKLHVDENLTIQRDNIYQISSLPQNHDALFANKNIIFYTSHEITQETTNDQLSSVKAWSEEMHKFSPQKITEQTILYDKLFFPNDPIVHTITICPLEQSQIDLQQCTQKHIIDNHDAYFDIGNKNILLTIYNNQTNKRPVLMAPYVKKYHIPFTTKEKIYISALAQNNQIPSIEPKNILLFKRLSNNHEIIIYKKDDELFAKMISPDKTTNAPFHIMNRNTLLQKYTTKTLPLIQDKSLQTDKSHINIFHFNNETFISIALKNKEKSAAEIDLFKVDDGMIHNVYSTPITSYDKNVPNQFFVNALTNDFYVITNNYLRQFQYANNKFTPIKTIDYTKKPVYKPKLKIEDFPVGAKIVNGKYVCKKTHKEYVGKSKKNNKRYYHLDRECCLDPDEYPNPWCTYRPGELAVTNLRYKDYTGKKIRIKKH